MVAPAVPERPVPWRRATPRSASLDRRRARTSSPNTASPTSVSPPPTCSSRRVRRCSSGAAAGLHADMGFTYRDPERSTDPLRAVAGARSVIVAAKPYLTDDDPPPPRSDCRPARPRRAVRVGRPLRAAALGAARGEPTHPPIRPPGGRVRRRQLDRRPRRRPSCRARLVRQERQPAAARGGQLVRARLDRHDRCRTNRRPGRSPDGCGTCTRCIDDCPTGAIIAPGVIDANRCISWILQQPGLDPRRVPSRDRRSDLRLRRLPGRLSDLGSSRPRATRSSSTPTPTPGSMPSSCSRPTTRDRGPIRPLVRHRSRLPLGPAQRARRRRQRRAIRPMRGSGGCWSTTVPTSTRSSPNTPPGPPTVSRTDARSGTDT